MCQQILESTLETERTPFTQNTHYLEATTEKWLAKYKDIRAGKKDLPDEPRIKRQRMKTPPPMPHQAHQAKQPNGICERHSISALLYTDTVLQLVRDPNSLHSSLIHPPQAGTQSPLQAHSPLSCKLLEASSRRLQRLSPLSPLNLRFLPSSRRPVAPHKLGSRHLGQSRHRLSKM